MVALASTLYYFYYVQVPLEDVARHFLDVLEFSELRGMVYLQSVVNAVQTSSMRHYRRICRIVRHGGGGQKSKGSVFFPNEFCAATHVQRKEDESLKEWKTR